MLIYTILPICLLWFLCPYWTMPIAKLPLSECLGDMSNITEHMNCLLHLSLSLWKAWNVLLVVHRKVNQLNTCNQVYKQQQQSCSTAAPLAIYILLPIARKRKVTYYILHLWDMNLIFLHLQDGKKNKTENQNRCQIPKVNHTECTKLFQVKQNFHVWFSLLVMIKIKMKIAI